MMQHCLNCGLSLEESEFCNADCEREYLFQEEYVCSCFSDEEPDEDEVGLGEVDEQQENQDFAQDDYLGYQNEE